MGLLEKALHYKNDMAGRGQKTIMDRITGPAQTGAPYQEGMVGNSDPILPDDDIPVPWQRRPRFRLRTRRMKEQNQPHSTGPDAWNRKRAEDDEEAARKRVYDKAR